MNLNQVFRPKTSMDPVVARNRRVASRSLAGGTTRAAQAWMQESERDCPWQLFQDPDTGETRIERKYDPQDEPLSETMG